MSKYLIGVDIGTQGTKSIIFNDDFQIIAQSFEESNLISPRPGVVEQDPDEMYGSVVRTIKDIIDQSGVNAADIAGIGMDGQMAGIMGVDENFEAATPYDSWLDMRCGKYVEEMKKTAGKEIIESAGAPVSYNHGPKIVWWKREHPEVYAKIKAFVEPCVYCIGRMCELKGEDAYFDYTNLHFTTFADNKNKKWNMSLLREFDIEAEKMPRIVSPDTVVGHSSKAFENLTGVKAGTPVVAGLGDQAAGCLGTGIIKPGLISDSAGTASTFTCCVDSYRTDAKHMTMMQMRSAVDGVFTTTAYIQGGGMGLRWVRDELTGKTPLTYDELSALAAEIAPGSEGVIFVPHFAGRVLPNMKLKGSFTGLDWNHNIGHLFRATMESVGYDYKYFLSIVRENYPELKIEKILCMGGGSKSPVFNQIKADILGLPYAPLTMEEAALTGSAMAAAKGAGLCSYEEALAKLPAPKYQLEPNMENYEKYKPYAEVYLEVMEALKGIYEKEVYSV